MGFFCSGSTLLDFNTKELVGSLFGSFHKIVKTIGNM
jgi:hypothetical protein